MNKSRIKKAETELKHIENMKKDLKRYIDCAWKSTLLKSCGLVEVVWKKELKRLKELEALKAAGKTKSVKAKKTITPREKKFESLSSSAPGEIAFSIQSPDHMAQIARAKPLSWP